MPARWQSVRLLLVMLIPLLSWAADGAAAEAGGPGMGSSLAIQRKSVQTQRQAIRRQVAVPQGSAVDSFFTAPWSSVTPIAPVNFAAAVANPADCDPLPDQEVSALVEAAAGREGVKPALVRAVIHQESAFRPCAVSAKGAQGLMQLMPATAEQFHVTDPFDPAQNVDAGTKLLKQLLTKYAGDLRLALGAYNAGLIRVDQAGGVPDIPETKDYVSKILQDAGIAPEPSAEPDTAGPGST